MRYFIIGFKNSGKTTFGRKLARMLHLDFIDLDEYIEQREGKSIPDIYSEIGDEPFRRLEWRALRELVKKDQLVIATGGGAPCHCDNMSLMEKYGEVIYLHVSDDILISRLRKATADRPIVRGKSEEELRHYIVDVRNRCEHHYKRAKFIVEGENVNMSDLVKELTAPDHS